jgi:hypothetical protein
MCDVNSAYTIMDERRNEWDVDEDFILLAQLYIYIYVDEDVYVRHLEGIHVNGRIELKYAFMARVTEV